MPPIERIPICSQVVTGIQTLIEEQNLQPGDKMPTEKVLCEMFGVGRSTVREAMRILQAMGVLSLQQGRGAFVGDSYPSQDEGRPWFKEVSSNLRDYVEMRLAVEPLCTRLAIERASEEEIAEIARIHSLFIQAVSKNDPISLAKYDELFHMEIAKATHNKLMVSIQEAIRKTVFDMRVQSFSVRERMSSAIPPHTRLLDAFYHHDASEGERAMIEHLQEAFHELL